MKNLLAFLLFSVASSFSAFADKKSELLVESLKEVADFGHYNHRPYKSNSREDAFKKLTNHCRSMADYHENLSELYTTKLKRYENEAKTDSHMAKLKLELFIKKTLGFDLPMKTDARTFVAKLSSLHKDYQKNWLGKIAGLTGEKFLWGDELIGSTVVLSRDVESSQKILGRFKKDFEEFYLLLSRLVENPEKYVKSDIARMGIDEVWAIRHAYALIADWARSDEEILAKQIEEKRREKNHRRRQKRKKVAGEKRRREQVESARVSMDKEEPEEKGGKYDEEKDQFQRQEPVKVLEKKKEVKSIVTQNTQEDETKVNSPKEVEIFPQSTTSTIARVVDMTNEEPEEKGERQKTEEGQEYNHDEFVEKERSLSKQKKEQQIEPKEVPVESEPSGLIGIRSEIFYIDKKSYGFFMDLFEKRELAFKDFEHAFTSGLGGAVFKNRGGAMRTFERGWFTFGLHEPHGKGQSVFHKSLRKRAIKQLARLGVTKDTIQIGKKK